MYDLPERKRGSKYVVNEDIVLGNQAFLYPDGYSERISISYII